VGGIAFSAPAQADPCTGLTANQTCATFTVNAGGLSITVPSATATLTQGGGPAILGELAGTVSGQLGATTVTDLRGILSPGWAVTASSTNFTTTGGAVVAKANVTAFSGTPTDLTSALSGVAVPSLLPVNIGTPATIVSTVLTIGLSNHLTYNPTVGVTIPTSATPGTYTGVITQTVS
jgi:hypothetical protein